MSTPSKNTRLAIAKKQALLLEDAATTPSVNEGVDLATPPFKNTRLAKKRLGGKKQVLLLEDAATTPSVNEGAALATAKSATKKSKGTPKKTPAGKKPGSNKTTPKAKEEEEEETTETGTQTAIVAANSGYFDVPEWAKKKFAAQDKQNKEVAAQFKTQNEEIATIREDQEGTKSDLTRLGVAVVDLGNILETGLQGIKGLSDYLVGAIRLFDARTKANRNFASTTAFFAIVLAAILGYYLLAATFLAITLGLYFTKNLCKK